MPSSHSRKVLRSVINVAAVLATLYLTYTALSVAYAIAIAVATLASAVVLGAIRIKTITSILDAWNQYWQQSSNTQQLDDNDASNRNTQVGNNTQHTTSDKYTKCILNCAIYLTSEFFLVRMFTSLSGFDPLFVNLLIISGTILSVHSLPSAISNNGYVNKVGNCINKAADIVEVCVSDVVNNIPAKVVRFTKLTCEYIEQVCRNVQAEVVNVS